MNLIKPENENYAGTIVDIKSITPLEGADNIVGTPIFGFQAIVGKNTNVGDVGIVFPAETQLSPEFCYENNLYSDPTLNKDNQVKGYLSSNRRIRSIKLRGNRSDCLFMPLSSLQYIKALDTSELAVGDAFDQIAEHQICNKYVIQRATREQRLEKNKKKFISRVDEKFLPKHHDSDNYFKYSDTIPEFATVIVTQKLHGTSIRIANTIVNRTPSLLDRIAGRLGAKIQRQEMAYVFGSKNVIKDPNNPNQQHFYEEDIWTEKGRELEGILPENYIIYGELIGWTSTGSPIQSHYTYGIMKGSAHLYVYRVAFINGQGIMCDLTWDQVLEFCRDHGLMAVPELWRGTYAELKPNVTEWFMDKKFKEGGHEGAVELSEDSPVDEGVCIRVDGIAPYILKAKSPLFYEHETSMLDQEVIDIETEGAQDA